MRSESLRALLSVLACSAALAACGAGPDSPPGPSTTTAGSGGGSAAVGGSQAMPGGISGGTSQAGTTTGGSATGGTGAAAGGSGGGGGSEALTAGAGGTVGGSASAGELTVEPAQGLWTGVRYYTGATPSGRTSGPQTPPEKAFKLHNSSAAELALTLSISGADAARFRIVAPATPLIHLAAGADADVRLSIITDNAMLSPAPAQNDGATVFNASLEIASGAKKLAVRNYALVLTYAELEPTFGQILKAFPEWTTKLPSWLPDSANPNPGTPLPGVVAGTDEVAATAFERIDATKPVTLRPLGRFSPSGLVPFGWYEPGKIAGRTTAGTLAMQTDPQTNDKARMLEPPLASGSTSFEPSVTRFGIWMAPAGVGLLTSNDADGFDGQHRVRAFTLHDAQGAVVPGGYLIGGEEAKNGDYQDYVFVLTNVKPSP